MKQNLLLLATLLTLCSSLQAQQTEIFAKDSIAINGYDPVAYFKEAKPVKGNTDFSIVYKGVNWIFANKENAELFRASPEKFEPQYGGYCAFGCSKGYKAKTSPDAWTIIDDKLYLNYNTDVRETWNKDQKGYIEKANAHWVKIKGTKYP